MDTVRRIAPLLVLAAAFAVFVQMCVVLAGRVPAGALTAALTAGALAVALLTAPRPLAALRSLDRTAVIQACLAGLLAVAGAPALVAAMRMSDAPAGSIVVFWIAGGWAAIAACAAAVLALRARNRLMAGWSLAGAMLALAGVAGIVADWERPSSFSPLVRFASREVGMLLGGVLLLAGGLLLLRAARSARLDGALVWASGTALVASLAWREHRACRRGGGRSPSSPLPSRSLRCRGDSCAAHGRRPSRRGVRLPPRPRSRWLPCSCRASSSSNRWSASPVLNRSSCLE